MNVWRKKMLEQTKQQLYSMSINNPEKLVNFFEKEFHELTSEIEKEYPGTCKVAKNDNVTIFSIGKSEMHLILESSEKTIKLLISRISSNNGELKQWGIIRFDEVTYVEMLLPLAKKGEKLFIDKYSVDYLMECAFETPWLF